MPSSWFRIAYAESAFRRFAAERQQELDGLRLPAATDLVLAFYRKHRAQHTTLEADGDMLLWQWGADAGGEAFTVDLTRQFIRDGADQPVVQLAVILRYRWSPARRELGRGSLWCHSPAGSADFERALRSSEAYRAVASAVPIELRLACYEV